jgi:hypothetical protein
MKKYNGRPSFHSDGLHTISCEVKISWSKKKQKKEEKHNIPKKIEIGIHRTEKNKKKRQNTKIKIK